MAYVNPSTQSIKTCFQSRYSLPYFQREYKWEPRHFSELINDVQEAFLLSFDDQHGRTEVASYSPYFLGSIITSVEVGGKKPLIDGQQRLTSIFLLLSFLERMRRDNAVDAALDLSTLLGSVSFGVMDYSIEFSASRKAVFDAYLNKALTLDQAIEVAEDVTDLDEGDERLLEALRDTEALLDSSVKSHIAYFIDYVVERVLLIDISVASEAEAHRVFVTMNDRGLRLGPIDLLKGQILSKIPTPVDSQTCHSIWVDSINQLRSLGAEEDSLFFRTLLRAKWADTIRGKSKGDAPGDFDNIGDAYHRWFDENTAKLGIANGDDYLRFAKIDIPKYVEIYIFIKQAEASPIAGHEVLYYNAVRKFSFQSMILMATTSADDITANWKAKILLVARLVDVLLTSRTLEGKQNNYENLRDIAFNLTRTLRSKTEADLWSYVKTEWPKYFIHLSQLSKLSYVSSDKSDLLFLLARIATYLEDQLNRKAKTGFVTFWKRDRNQKTFDIEHLLKSTYDASVLPLLHGFVDAKDYAEQRSLLGALILLPRSINRSLQDKPYKEKVPKYAFENILAQTLASDFYKNNPDLVRFNAASPEVGLAPVADVDKNNIAARGATYTALARLIWAAPEDP
ncbi:MAG TPA: hypothetical protein DD666_15960 [Advenella kashmirensis]|uniref:GmrSD restriction endonucleases N-terminal domain-containing protein n=1 Tax=Advenella kashmirensis TaxID=310575 RepID=A0A356LJ64_9BURK|nr:hypothetical protein [Advenella kashmirensis]